MKKIEITCDGCSRDLTSRTNSVDYRLVLAAESKPGYGAGAYTDVAIWPPVDRDYHFCGLACLDHWRARENHIAALWAEANEKWRQENGRYSQDGRSYSGISMPPEVVKAKGEEFKAAALLAFPLARPKRT